MPHFDAASVCRDLGADVMGSIPLLTVWAWAWWRLGRVGGLSPGAVVRARGALLALAALLVMQPVVLGMLYPWLHPGQGIVTSFGIEARYRRRLALAYLPFPLAQAACWIVILRALFARPVPVVRPPAE